MLIFFQYRLQLLIFFQLGIFTERYLKKKYCYLNKNAVDHLKIQLNSVKLDNLFYKLETYIYSIILMQYVWSRS